MAYRVIKQNTFHYFYGIFTQFTTLSFKMYTFCFNYLLGFDSLCKSTSYKWHTFRRPDHKHQQLSQMKNRSLQSAFSSIRAKPNPSYFSFCHATTKAQWIVPVLPLNHILNMHSMQNLWLNYFRKSNSQTFLIELKYLTMKCQSFDYFTDFYLSNSRNSKKEMLFSSIELKPKRQQFQCVSSRFPSLRWLSVTSLTLVSLNVRPMLQSQWKPNVSDNFFHPNCFCQTRKTHSMMFYTEKREY